MECFLLYARGMDELAVNSSMSHCDGREGTGCPVGLRDPSKKLKIRKSLKFDSKVQTFPTSSVGVSGVVAWATRAKQSRASRGGQDELCGCGCVARGPEAAPSPSLPLGGG